ncbi:hypothetical protein [Mesorhizobium australicum]|uniref:Secreted protein n=1 Tax=Mesorhizobium australicum TaxID=536018 RepID=A0A1X7N5B1_9HYPH|nr:hypothetical protein [Mesorhizobium australicum]SMH32025.1 hypothetical protein SAMN02982922_1226 [Mesorhizobium australicum]
MRYLSRRLAALMMLCAAASPAGAQTAPSIYDGASPMATCTNMDPPRIACLKTFPKTPSTTRVLIRSVNCYIYSSVRMDRLTLGMTEVQGGPTKKKVFIPIKGETVVNSTYVYTINEPVYFYVGRDRFLELSLSFVTYGMSGAECSIAGEYVQ